MATLNIQNRFEVLAQGGLVTGREAPSALGNPPNYGLSVTGLADKQVGSLATAAVVTLWSASVGRPSSWTYFHVVADQNVDLQLVGTGSNVILALLANVPFTLGVQSLLAAASTTAITGGAQPSLTTIQSINLGNYSGSTANYTCGFVL